MDTMLLRIGAHIGAAKCPRVFSTAAISALMPVKNSIGSIRYDSRVTSVVYAGSSLPAAYTAVSTGASTTAISAVAARASTARVSRRCAYASPRSASILRRRTSTGTRTLVSTPPSRNS